MKYDFAAIEKKWQEKWEQEKPYAAVTGDKKPKFYGLIEFPYPSAAGLHVGHRLVQLHAELLAGHTAVSGQDLQHIAVVLQILRDGEGEPGDLRLDDLFSLLYKHP